MQEPENRREEKLEGREIRIGDTTIVRRERPHGKLYRWLDNYWYHHKWKTIIIAFFLIVFIVCAVQCGGKAPEADVSILIAGPTNFSTAPAGTADLEGLLSNCLPTDYNGDGVKNVEIRHYMILSKDQIQKLQGETDENGVPLYVDTATASDSYSNYMSYLQTGEATILILDRWAFEEIKHRNLVNINTILEDVPEGAIVEEDGRCFGIRLKETALYREQLAFQVLENNQYLDEDPIICVHYRVVGSDEARHNVALEVFKSLVG